jgi:UrcA family protein
MRRNHEWSGDLTMNSQLQPVDRSFVAYKLMPGAALSAILALAPGVLIAQSRSAMNPEVVAAKVSLADLDLTTPEGAHVAHDRLAAAALALCNKFGDTRKVSDVATRADCTRDAFSDALRRLHAHPLVADGASGHR